MLSWGEIESNAIGFARTWKDCAGDERQEAQTFEKDFMSIFGVDWHEGLHEHQVRDMQGKIGYIDYLLPGRILIEMKSKGESLTRAYNQGYDYVRSLKPDEYPELLMVSDFDYIQVTNLSTMQTFKKFKISQLKNHIRMFGKLAGYNSEVTFTTDIQVNTDASYKMAKLHDILKENGYEGEALEIYLVRLLFCLFADCTGIFDKGSFESYISNSKEDGSDLSSRIMLLFDTLNTNKRMATLPDELKTFRFINGDLFSKQLPPAYFDRKMRDILLECCNFDWSYISPAIFGAMFQGVMDEQKRREMGAHYTSEENILRLVKPLFLDELWDEFEKSKSTKAELEEFHNKLTTLKFLDPACGCGNFLIITYRELRLLEFEVLKMTYDNKQLTMIEKFCEISINQFYGIEYEEFACQIAHVGMLLIKHQMDKEVSNYFGMNLIDFPIKESANIIHGNALRIDWNDVVSSNELSYIIGNPPFVGARNMSRDQKDDMLVTFGKIKGFGNLDYVTAWYKKASEYINGERIKVAFVSTNSICQGEQVPLLWKPLFEKLGINISFAYKNFKWSNEARGKANVTCVMIGFSYGYQGAKKIIFGSDGKLSEAKNINGYLLDAPNIFIESKSKPICDVPSINYGSFALDDGNFTISEKEYHDLIDNDVNCKKFIKPFIGAKEIMHNIKRFCVWLEGVNPREVAGCKQIKEKVDKVREWRINSDRKATRGLSEYAALFAEIRQPKTNYLAIPTVCSEKRRYIPMVFLTPDIIASNQIYIVADADLYHFGVLQSNVHMSWMRAVGGKLETRYRYSSAIVYNNFPWPNISDEQKHIIAVKAQGILNARVKYKDSSLAEMYDNLQLYTELNKAHIELNKEVWKAYNAKWNTEEECVADLMRLYQQMVTK